MTIESQACAPIRVVHFQRRPQAGQVSVERLFAEIRRQLPPDIECRLEISPELSKGLWPRVQSTRAAGRRAARVNHVTGDVQYLALGLPRAGTLLTVLDCVSLERLRGLRRWLFRTLWYDLPVRRAGLVSVISESTRRELLRLVRCDAAKLRVVPCCVGSEFVRCDRPFNAAHPVILQVGTGQNKNLDRVVQALIGLPCHLKIIGTLNDDQRALLAAARLNYSNLARATDAEVVQAYQECDLVLFPSTYEGFGLPIVEGQATGRPVVTSRLLSMPEVAGKAACLVDPFDVLAIRAGVRRVIGEAGYRAALVADGFENVRRYSARTVAEQYAVLYRELAAQTSNAWSATPS